MRKIYLTIIIACYFLNAYSQRVDYDHTSKWFLGFNVGATWNSTDVKNQTSAGWGFTLGKSYNYDYGKILSFDLRGRYLRGYWYGQDFDTTSLANYSGGALTSYNDSLGFSVNNFQADVHRLALELAIHANKLRERTGLDPYIFGGVGLTWNQTYGDLKNEFGDYAYDDLLNNGTLNSSMIENTLDGIFDTPLDESSDKYKVNFMPSLGFGLGYQVGKRVTLGIEHKTTFTLDDNFDGYISTSPRTKNDRYHYTSFYIQFRFRTNESTDDNDETTNTSNNINNYNTACPKPTIIITEQSTTINSNNYLLLAVISNVNNANEITLSDQNGVSIPFTYNANTNKLQANINVTQGSNTYTLSAQNNCGRDSKTITINFNPCANPIVTITNPSSRETTVASPNYVFTAIAQNVTNQQGISLFVNNILQTNFTYNAFSGQIQSNIYLTPGVNTIRIDVLNNCGSNTASSTIIYNNCITPQLQLITPSTSGSTVSSSAINIKMNLIGFNNRNNFSILQNGVQISTFSVNNGILEIPLQLALGVNTITVNGTNQCGSDAISFAVTYQTCSAPILSLILPATTISTTTSAAFRFRIKVENSQKADILLMLNNQQITNFTYNPTTKIVESSMNLLAGMNTIIINASNPCGTAIETISINNENCKTPSVAINGLNNSTVTNSSFALTALIENMPAIQGISVTHNGNPINFDYSNGLVSCFSTLLPGINTFIVAGTNGCGRVSKTFTVTYNNCIAPQINLINPLASGITVGNANYNFQATVTNISSAQGLSLIFNGANLPVNFLNGVITEAIILREGRNQIQVNATNSCGTDNEVIAINYSLCKSPVITIQTPNNQITSTNNASVVVNGTVQNISSAQEISLMLNNIAVPVTLTGDLFMATLNFQPGLNTIKITATNTCGSDVFLSNITYNNCIAPSITLGSVINANSLTQQIAIVAGTQNITSAQQVSLMLNGISQTFTFLNNTINASLNLVSGLNTIVISVNNTCGNDIKTIQTTYVPCSAPVLNITSPVNAGLSVNSSTFVFSATAANVPNAQSISLTLNDIIQQNSVFSNGTITCNLTLQPGLNTIVVQVSTACGRESKLSTVNFNNCVAPVASSSIIAGSTVNTASYNYVGEVQNVSNSQNINLTLNGQIINNFNYSNGQITATVNLQPGINTFYLSGTNPCGNDNEISVVNYSACIPPVVIISNPSGAQVIASNYTILANIQNINSLQNIMVTMNGTPISALTYNNGQLAIAVNLQPGLNQLVISANNACGSDTKNHSVEFINCQQPSITLSGLTGSSVTNSMYQLQASVDNVSSAQGLALSLNGNTVSNFTYINGQLTCNTNLLPGTNVFVLAASNACGNTSETFIINYAPCLSPVVSINAGIPNNTSTVNSSINLNASILNYDNQTIIQITKNGNIISGYSNNNGQLSGIINLPMGLTTIIVTATKTCGQDSDTYEITRCKAPTVSLNTPNNASTSVQTPNYFIQVNLANVDNINMVTSSQNGNPITNMTLSNTILGGQVILQPGLNTFVISVNTGCGVASTTFQITYAQQNNGNNISPNGQDNGTDNNGQKVNDGDNKNNKPVTPEPVKPVTPEPVKPKPVKPVTPQTVKPVTPQPVKPVTPEPEKPVTPEPEKPKKTINPKIGNPTEKKAEEKGGG